MQFPKNSKVYLDSNFLIAYFVPNHQDHKLSVILFARLLTEANTCCLSPLTIDETLHGLRNEFNILRKKKRKHPKPHSYFYDDLKDVIDQLIKFPAIKIRQFEQSVNQGCRTAVNNIKKFSLSPKDAFTSAYLQDWNVKFIATNDSNFDSLSSISIKRIAF